MNTVPWADWSDRRKPSLPGIKRPVSKVYVHHSVTPAPAAVALEIRQLRQIDAGHRAKGWAGIGYNWLIGPSGTVYEGRGDRIGAQNDGENSTSVGICFLGTFTRTVPTPAALIACAELIHHLAQDGDVAPGFVLRGHGRRRDGSVHDGTDATQCPGDALYRALPELYRMTRATPAPATPEEEPIPMNPHPVHEIHSPAAGIAMTPSGKGYVIVTQDGGVYCFGDAAYLGGLRLVSGGQ